MSNNCDGMTLEEIQREINRNIVHGDRAAPDYGTVRLKVVDLLFDYATKARELCRKMREEAIQKGYGRYNPINGEFEFLQSSDAIFVTLPIKVEKKETVTIKSDGKREVIISTINPKEKVWDE